MTFINIKLVSTPVHFQAIRPTDSQSVQCPGAHCTALGVH